MSRKTKKSASRSKLKKLGLLTRVTAAGLCFALMSGCGTTYHKKKVDKQIYGSIEEMQKQVFGEAENFTIDTRYSRRDPNEILADELIKERMEEGVLKLTLDDALKIAVEYSREYQTQKETLFVSALNLSDSEFSFANVFDLRSRPNIERESNGDIRGSVANDAGVSRALISGGRLSAALANDLVRYFTGDPRRELINTLSVDFSRPLLRGAGKDIVGETLKQAERNVIYSVRNYAFFQRSFAIGVVNDFFSMLGRKATVRNNYEDFQSRVISVARARERSKFIESPEALQLAIQEELSRKNRYIQSVTEYLNALDNFKQRLGIPITVEIYLDDSALKELEELGIQEFQMDPENSFAIAVETHLELLNDIDRYEDSKRKIKVAANDLLPGLDVNSSASLNWEDEENYREFDVDEVRANMGLRLDLPVNRWIERNRYRRRLIDFEAALRRLAAALDLKRVQIEAGFRDLETDRLVYANNVLGVENAIRRVSEQELKNEAGLSTQQTLIDAQNALIIEKNQLIQSLTSYLRNRLAVQLDIGLIDTEVQKFWLNTDLLAQAGSKMKSDPQQTDEADRVITPAELFKETNERAL